MKNILIIGSINMDHISYVDNFPKIGETVNSVDYKEFFGGKGVNQAVAIANMSNGNCNIYFLGKIGDDEAGSKSLENMMSKKIDVSYVKKTNYPTGIATIVVSKKQNDNFIIVNPGANEKFDEGDVKNLEDAIKKSDYVLMQLETNNFIVEKALKFIRKHGKLSFVNPAPAAKFNEKWLPYIDWLIPNETELKEIVEICGHESNNFESNINFLLSKKLKNLLVTKGSKGAIYKNNNCEEIFVPSFKSNVVDTTAAGDTFIGTFISWFDKLGIRESMLISAKAASITVSRKGAQDSIPLFKEVKYEKK